VTLTRPDRVYDGYAFDLDGTVYLGDRALPGAVDSIARLRADGRPVVFVTNKPLELASDYAAKLTRLGIPATEADVVTAVESTVHYLQANHRAAVLLTVAESAVDKVLAEAGFVLTSEPASAEVVVVSFDRTFDYAKLNAAYRAVRLHGARLVATNPDPFCPTPDGGLPDCAAMLAAIEACTGARAEAVTGKPSRYMADAVLARLGLPAERVALVGDRLTTDMVMAETAGMVGVLVLSGVAVSDDVAAGPARPRHVIDDLRQLLPTARSAAR
jgi:HAD superfamily hydrolase (TIGR01450 family)